MQELHDTVCCSASCCVAQLETLLHPFMGCPVVQPAVAWLGALWSKVVAGVQLPLDARVLLAGDHTVWDPGVGMPGGHCGPICACCFDVLSGTFGATGWRLGRCSQRLQWLG